MNEIPELKLALFGQSGSGKTTLLASYFGNLQRASFEQSTGYRLEAENTSIGNQLLQRYYNMENDGRFPLGTDQFVEYRFGLKVGDLPEPGLNVVWYDYPGGWWEREPVDFSERVARKNAISQLLTSHVGVILIDGQRYLSEGINYVRHLLDQFKAEIRRIKDFHAAGGNPIDDFPKQWVIAISKADVLPEGTTAQMTCGQIVGGAADQLAGIAKALESDRFGDQFLHISSVQGDGSRVLDAHRYVGLQLIAPVAFLAVLTEIAEKAGSGTVWNFLNGVVRRVSNLTELIDSLDDFLPAKYRLITMLIKAMDIKDALDKTSEWLREKQIESAKRGQVLKAVNYAMLAELRSEAAKFSYFKNQ
jgi:hypothetical protein